MTDGPPDDPFEPAIDADTETESGPTAFPWPPRVGESSIDALGRTWSDILIHPTRLFCAMPADAPLVPAVVFLLIATYAGAGANLFWQMVLPAPAWVLPELRANGAEAVSGFLLAGPFAMAVTTVVALMVHGALIVFGARREHARSTVVVLYYVSASSIFQVVPWIGSIIGGLWGIVVAIIGVREVHGASTGRAAAAVLVPMFAVIGFVALLVILVVVAGLSTGLITR